jgi:transcriptional regulator with XRE-family HTH domain
MSMTGERLRSQRKKRGLSLRAVAKYEKKSPSYLSALERGENEPGVWELLASLTRRYGTTADYLLGLTDDPCPPAVDIKKPPAEAEDLIDSYMRLSAPIAPGPPPGAFV